MRTFGNLQLQVVIASVPAAFFASLSVGVSAGEPVRATGTVEPEEIVDVGAQVTGMIKSLGLDPSSPGKAIDYGSRVEAGTVLARLDDAVYQADVEAAQAVVARAEAELEDAKVKVKFGIIGAPTQLLVPAIEATLAKYRAELKRAQVNLGYTLIKSSVKGVIIDRRVNVGQIVGPTPTPGSSLFLIAKDLRKLQVWVSVPEKHISRIRVGDADDLHCRRLSKAGLSGQSEADSPERPDDAERRDLHRGGDDR